MPDSNALTYLTAATGYGTALLAQVAGNPTVETIGLGAAVVGTIALAIRTGGEVMKSWLAYKDSALHACELRAEVTHLQAMIDANRKLARRGVCPYDDDGQATCGVHQRLPEPPSH